MKSKKIAVFGCSWSHGIPELKYENWVTELSILRPEHTFYNFAIGGTSMPFHLHLFEKAKKHLNPDITIFQYSSVGRFTWWKDFDLTNCLTKKADNLYGISDQLEQYYDRINIGVIDSKKFAKTDKSKHRFGVEYYKRLNYELMKLDKKAYINYCSQVTDLQFHHKDTDEIGGRSVYNQLGKEKFENFVVDSGHHFDAAGNKWQATWVDDLLTERGLI